LPGRAGCPIVSTAELSASRHLRVHPQPQDRETLGVEVPTSILLRANEVIE
jgi:hypothetical protein